jgi:hypothetical protein
MSRFQGTKKLRPCEGIHNIQWRKLRGSEAAFSRNLQGGGRDVGPRVSSAEEDEGGQDILLSEPEGRGKGVE